jgi:tetratricopeptide (TPR) repeat protein
MTDEEKKFETIFESMDQQNYPDVLKRTAPLMKSESEEIKYTACHLAGVANFHLGNYKDAQKLAEIVADKWDDANSWLSVITSSALAGDIEKSEAALNKAYEAQKRADFTDHPSFAFIRFYYANALFDAGAYEKSLEQLEELKKVYCKLKITDDHYLYTNGTPFFTDTLNLAKKVFSALQTDFTSSQWLEELQDCVDDDGKRFIEEIKQGTEI